MKATFTNVGIGRLCELFGKTRHAYYDKLWYHKKQYSNYEIVLEMLLQLRREAPGLGTPVIYSLIKTTLVAHDIKMGRVALHNFRYEQGLVCKPKRKYVKTTDSLHRFKKYANLIKDIKIVQPEKLWVSDITYIRVKDKFNFLSLITDGYSRMIVGYHLHQDLSTEGPLKALNMALSSLSVEPDGLIHHSDRGTQYCCATYIEILCCNCIAISMTENGDPYENAIAERVNGILKATFNLQRTFQNTEEAQQAIAKAITFYNNIRPHQGIENLTPTHAHGLNREIKRLWKPKTYTNTPPETRAL